MQETSSAIKKGRAALSWGVILSYLLIAINVVSGLLLAPAIISSVGKGPYGVYSAGSALVSMFLLDLGLGTAVTKFVSKYRVISTQEQIDKVIGVVTRCFLVLSAALLIIFGCVFPFLGSIYSSFSPEELFQFKIVYLMLAGYSVVFFPFSTLNGILVAYDLAVPLKLSDIISKLAFILATVIVIAFRLGLFWLTACYVLHGALSSILKLVFVLRKTPAKLLKRVQKEEFFSLFKEVITFSLWAAINTFGRVLLVSIAPSIMGSTTGAEEIAVFAIATQLESYVSLFATAFGSIFYPSISRILFENGEVTDATKEKFRAFHVSVARIQAMILAIVYVGLAVCGRDFIPLWLGDGYDKSYYCILIICAPALFFYPLQTGENAMAAMERIKYCAIDTLISLAVGALAEYLLSLLLGSIGVSLGIFLGFTLRTILFNYHLNRHLSIHPIRFYWSVYGSLLLPSLAAVITGVALNLLLSGRSWLYFIVKVAGVGSVYVFAVCLIGLNEVEKEKFDGLLIKIFTKLKAIKERL